jgi:glycosyltransferase involved in cell wall biosynthesis
MRILNISPAIPALWNFGGSVAISFEVVRELISQGHHVLALTTGARRNSTQQMRISEDISYEGIPIRCCKMWGPAPPFWSPELRRQVRLRAHDHDIALIRSCWTYVGDAASWECRRVQLPYLAYPEGSLDPWLLRYSRLKKVFWWHLWERDYFQGAAAIVANTRAEQERIRAMGLTNRIEVIPNGIHLPNLEAAVSRHELEGKWPQLKGNRWIIYMARLHPKKGLDLLLHAFAKITHRFPDHVLIIIGYETDGYAKVIKHMVEELGLKDKVLFTGPVYGDLKIGLLKEAEVFALTSYSEGQPMAVLDALGCGTPALITEECNVPEVAEVNAGFIVPISVESIAQSLKEMLNDDGLRDEMGNNARKLIVSRFTLKNIGHQTIALCEDILRYS